MRKIILILSFLCIKVFSQGTENKKTLTNLTFGIGVGGNHLFEGVYDYSLTTDATHALKVNETNRNNIVVSPIIIFRLGKVAKPEKSNKLFKVLSENDSTTEVPLDRNDLSRLSLLLSLDLVNVQSEKVSFNKSIDGGIGIGYSFSSNLMLGILYEIKSFRQIRPYIVEQYLNKGIPNGTNTEVFNALDINNNNVFYDKKIEGISLKLIFNINSL